MEHPLFIPTHACNVRCLFEDFPQLWLWEFSGGGHLYMAIVDEGGNVYQQIALKAERFRALVQDLAANQERYLTAIAEDIARQQAYDNWLAAAWEDDEYDDC